MSRTPDSGHPGVPRGMRMELVHFWPVVAVGVVGFTAVACGGTRYVRRVLRTGRIHGRGGMVYRDATPIGFWLTFLSALWVILFAGVFFAAVPLVFLWHAGAFRR